MCGIDIMERHDVLFSSGCYCLIKASAIFASATIMDNKCGLWYHLSLDLGDKTVFWKVILRQFLDLSKPISSSRKWVNFSA